MLKTQSCKDVGNWEYLIPYFWPFKLVHLSIKYWVSKLPGEFLKSIDTHPPKFRLNRSGIKHRLPFRMISLCLKPPFIRQVWIYIYIYFFFSYTTFHNYWPNYSWTLLGFHRWIYFSLIDISLHRHFGLIFMC